MKLTRESLAILENLYSTGCRDKFSLRNSLQIKLGISKQEAVWVIKEWVDVHKPKGINI